MAWGIDAACILDNLPYGGHLPRSVVWITKVKDKTLCAVGVAVIMAKQMVVKANDTLSIELSS